MANNNPLHALARRLGNHSSRRDLLGVSTFPGLSVDNVAITPGSGQNGATNLSSGSGSSSSSEVGRQIAGLTKQLADLQAVQLTHLQQLALNTQSISQNTSAKSNSGSSALGTIGSLASNLLGGVFGLSTIVQGLSSLFGGGTSQTQQPLVPFVLPTSINYAAGVTGPGSGAVPVDYGQGGLARSLAASNSKPASSSSTIQISVNAMDSRSFLDHSDEIASAVRAALLNSHSLGDVISNL